MLVVVVMFLFMALLTPLIQDSWSDFVERNGDTVYTRVIFPWAISSLFYWAYGLLLLFVDFKHIPRLFYQRKYQPKAVMKPEGSIHMPPLRKCLIQVLFNQIFVLLPGILFLDWGSRQLGRGIRVDPILPSI